MIQFHLHPFPKTHHALSKLTYSPLFPPNNMLLLRALLLHLLLMPFHNLQSLLQSFGVHLPIGVRRWLILFRGRGGRSRGVIVVGVADLVLVPDLGVLAWGSRGAGRS